MQNAKLYSEISKRSHKHDQLTRIWKKHEGLFHWGPEEMVLDVGCGPGDTTVSVILLLLPEDFRLLVGVDISPSVINHALKYNAEEKVTFALLNIDGDISEFLQNKQYSSGFSKIFSFFVLHWLQDLKKGVENLHALLRPRGEMFLLFPVDRLFQKTFKIVRCKQPWKGYLKNVSRKIPPTEGTDLTEEFKKLLLKTGLEVVKCEPLDLQSSFDSIDDFKDLIESLDQDVDCIPADLKTKYLSDCLEVMEEMSVVETRKNKVVLTQSCVCVIARKWQKN